MISWEFPPHVVGGIGRHVTELAPVLGGLVEEDGPVYIDILTPDYAGGKAVESVTPYVTVYRVEMPPVDVRDLYNSVIANNQAFVQVALELGRQYTYGLIHIHDWLTGMAGIVLKHRWKRPLLATIHATERGRHQGNLPSNTSRYINEMEWKICFEAWRVIVCSLYMRQELADFFQTPFDKLDVIGNGIEVHQRLAPGPTELTALRHRYAVNGEKLLFFVGRVTHEKGLQVLVRAMPRILADHPQTRLLVAGKNGNTLWPLAYELNVEKSIEFLGYISDHERDCIYQVVDAAIFPSLYEPFGLVALEAMSLGCNVIVSDVGGLSEVVRHQENGLTVFPNDPQSIVWAVNALFADPEAAMARRRRALDETLSIYRWEQVAIQTAHLYQTILHACRRVDW
jgi:glycosyltransferase involved in cell wall biosynthesis